MARRRDSGRSDSGGRGFLEQPHTRAQGRVGEDRAREWLQAQGYRIVERNVRTRAGEIDLIAWDDDVLCFIEVKARASDAYGPAIAAVHPGKQRKLGRAASLYLVQNPTDQPCRFDVLGMDLDASGEWRYTLVRDAFRLA